MMYKAIPAAILLAALLSCTPADNDRAKAKLNHAGEQLNQDLKKAGREIEKDTHKAAQELKKDAHEASQEVKKGSDKMRDKARSQ